MGDGVYGDRFAGTGQKRSLRYNSHIAVVTGDTEAHTTWNEFLSTHGDSRRYLRKGPRIRRRISWQ